MQADAPTSHAAPKMTSQSQVTSGNRWIGFRGGPRELYQYPRPSQSYVALPAGCGLLTVRHLWIKSGADVDVIPPDSLQYYMADLYWFCQSDWCCLLPLMNLFVMGLLQSR